MFIDPSADSTRLSGQLRLAKALLGLPLPLSFFLSGPPPPTTFDLVDGDILDLELRAVFPGSPDPVAVKASAQVQAVRSLSISQSSRDLVLTNFEHRVPAAPADVSGQCTVTCPRTTRRIPLMQILESRGLEVYLVNAKHVKNVPGRRTDVPDCQWLQYLHAVGLLRASFRPAQDICAVRSLLRHRASLVDMATCHVQHKQKALDQMNLQLHHVISDITGTTGLAIVDAILEGNRDVHAMATLRDPPVRASHETIAKSLVGDYRQEHLFTLRQSVSLYREYQRRIASCEEEMQRLMKCLETKADPTATLPPPKDSVKKCKIMPPARAMALREEAYRILRVDLTTIPGISVLHVQGILAELGGYVSKFRSAGAFSSWMEPCPDNDISGGKVLWSGTRKVKNRIAVALRMAAQSLQQSESALGVFYRRMRAKLGAPKAITAAAHKLARIIFHMLTTRQGYDESVFAQAEQKSLRSMENRLRIQAHALGYTLLPAQS